VLVQANDTSLNVRRSPAEPRPGAPTVVCVHGFVIDDMSSFYFTLAGTLAPVANVVCYDMRGHGGSPVTPSGYTVAQQVDDLFALLHALGVEGPVHLFGYSYGASVVLTAALRRPERVASVVVLDGAYPVAGWGDELAFTFDLTAAQLSVDKVMEHLEITSRRRATRLCARIGQLVTDTTLRDEVVTEPELTDDDLRSIRQPALVCYGDRSDLVGRGRRLAQLLPDVEYHEMPGAGHRVIVERAEELRGLTLDWVRRHAAAGAGGTGG
jgi:pimeloyl-ACP methyl ester carboxylesterase